MKLTLPNGLTVEGTETQVRDIARSLGYVAAVPTENDGLHYKSSTHGLMLIRDMNTRHVVNAIRKLYRAEAEALSTDRVTLVQALRAGVGSKNVTLLALINELQARRD